MNPNGHTHVEPLVAVEEMINYAVLSVNGRDVETISDADRVCGSLRYHMFLRHAAALQWWLNREGE